MREIEAVRTEPFDPGTPQPVPEEIHQGNLPAVAAARPGEANQKQEPEKIPKALVKKSRMDKNRRAVRGCETHAAENLRLGTEGFPVEKVSPSADCLPDEYAE